MLGRVRKKLMRALKINGVGIGLQRMMVPASIYKLKINNRNTRTRCEIGSELIVNRVRLNGS